MAGPYFSSSRPGIASTIVGAASGNFVIPGVGVVTSPSASGSNTYSVSAAETATATDSPVVTGSFGITAAEMATVTEGSVQGALYAAAAAETAMGAESSDATFTYAVTGTDAVTTTDSAAAGLPASTSVTEGDPYLGSTTLLLHFNGSDGAQSTVDSSPSAHSVSFQTSPTISTAQSVFGGSSCHFPGVVGTNWLSVANNGDFNFGAGQFTVETRFQTTSTNTTQAIVGISGGSPTNAAWSLALVSGVLRFRFFETSTTSHDTTYTWTPAINTWYALAVDRDASGVIRLYINGSKVASATFAQTIQTSASNDPLEIGVLEGFESSTDLIGYLDELRITKGVARYASDSGYTLASTAFPDTATLADTSVVGPSAAAAETAAVTDGDDALVSSASAVTETATVTESEDFGITILAIDETAPITESEGAGLAAVDDLTETATVTESETSIQADTVAATESLTADESEGGALSTADEVDEVWVAIDSTNGRFDRTASRDETLTVTATAKGTFITSDEVDEAWTITVTREDGVAGTIFSTWEPFPVSDTTLSVYAGGVTVTELAAAADAALGGLDMAGVVADAWVPGEAPVSGLGRHSSLLELATIDMLTASDLLQGSAVGESLIVTMSATYGATVPVLLTELAPLTELSTTRLQALAACYESSFIYDRAVVGYALSPAGEANFLWSRQGQVTTSWGVSSATFSLAPSVSVSAGVEPAGSASATWSH